MRKILLILLAVIMVLPLLVIPAGAKTASDAAAFDKTSVGTDLAGTTIGGVKFDPARYGYNPLGDLQILTLLEYGYPEDPALYLYLYNPQDFALNTRDRRYAVTLALGGETEDYTKYTLKVLSTSGTDAHSRLWIKCRIDVGTDKLTAAFKDTPTRTYRLGEVELVTDGKVKSYGIGGEWTYSGTTAGGDLTCDAKLITVLSLDLHPLVYRGDGSASLGGMDLYVYDQINSVYFSMPKNFEENYGEIKSILCTWTEYDSGWILGCKTQEVYDLLNNNDAIGNDFSKHDSSLPTIYCTTVVGGFPYFAWNPWSLDNKMAVIQADVLQWLVKYSGKAKYGALLETDLRAQIVAMWNAYCNGEDNYFSTGGITRIVDIMKDQNFSVKVDDGSNWWQKVFSKDKGTATVGNQAFQRVTADALSDPEAQLLVDKSYKDELTKALQSATNKEQDLMVLHFAQSPYFSIPVKGKGSLWNNDTWVNDGKEDMYVCKEQLYMDFDIIQFTCAKNGENVVVPVAASPINVIGDLQFFGKNKGDVPWWVILLIAIALIVIVVILCPSVIPLLIRFLLLPIRLLAWLLRAIGKGFAALFHKRE